MDASIARLLFEQALSEHRHSSNGIAARFAGSCASALRATPPAARGAEEAPAIPAARHRLQRIAHQLSHKKNFDHRRYLSSPGRTDRAAFPLENAALFVSAMQWSLKFSHIA